MCRSFGVILKDCRRQGVGDPKRRPLTQESFGDGIKRGVDAVQTYEKDRIKPPEEVFRRIVQFFTRADSDADERALIDELNQAYANWPNKCAQGHRSWLGQILNRINDQPRAVIGGLVVLLGICAAFVLSPATNRSELSSSDATSAADSMETDSVSGAPEDLVLAPWQDGDCLYEVKILGSDSSHLRLAFPFGDDARVLIKQIHIASSAPVLPGASGFARLEGVPAWIPVAVVDQKEDRLLAELDTKADCAGSLEQARTWLPKADLVVTVPYEGAP